MVCPLSELEYGLTWVGHIQLLTPGTLMAVGVESTTVYGPFQMGANWDAGDPSLQVFIRTDVPGSQGLGGGRRFLPSKLLYGFLKVGQGSYKVFYFVRFLI